MRDTTSIGKLNGGAAVAAAIAALALAGAAAAPARAALRFAAGQPQYDAAPGAAIDVQIFLEDTGSAVTGGGGLFSAGFLARRTSAESPAAVITSYAANTALFDKVRAEASYYDDDAAGVWAEQADTFGTPAQPIAGRVLLGTLAITAPGLPGGVAQYALEDLAPATTQFVTYTGAALDSQVAPGTFTVTAAVPEPATALTALGGACLLARRRR